MTLAKRILALTIAGAMSGLGSVGGRIFGERAPALLAPPAVRKAPPSGGKKRSSYSGKKPGNRSGINYPIYSTRECARRVRQAARNAAKRDRHLPALDERFAIMAGGAA